MIRTFKDYLLIGLKGIGMGAADVVPGVSGGTIAFISGIYEELLGSIKGMPLAVKDLLLGGFKLKRFWKEGNVNFLLALLVGIGISFLSLAKLMQYLLAHQAILTWSFFFGLIVASSWYVVRQINKWSVHSLISFVLGAAVAYWITMVSPAETSDALWFVFLSGAIAICAMILPGISGSFILLLLGKYDYMLKAITSINIIVIASFAAGALVGIISFSSVLSWLLKRYHSLTVALLGGFMIGSLNKIWPWKEVLDTFQNSKGEMVPIIERNILPSTFEQLNSQPAMVGLACMVAVFGFSIVFLIEWIAGKLATEEAVSM